PWAITVRPVGAQKHECMRIRHADPVRHYATTLPPHHLTTAISTGRHLRPAALHVENRSGSSDEIVVAAFNRFAARYTQETMRDVKWNAAEVKDRGKHDAYIQPEAMLADVVQIIGELSADACQIRVGRQLNLRQASQTGAHLQSAAVADQG